MGLADKVREKSEPHVPGPTEIMIECYYNVVVLEKLLESYRNTGLPWVKGFVDELYGNPDDFENVCKKYKIDITGGTVEKDNTYVLRASYNDTTDSYKINLTKNCLDDVDRGAHKDEFEVELHEFLVHEETHRQQNQLNSRLQPYYDLSKDATVEETIKHLSQRIEIDANARGVAYEASEKMSREDLLGSLIKGDLDEQLSEKATTVLRFYKYIGGDVWRRFLKKAYEYLKPNHSGGLADYNAWLANHKTVDDL